MHTPFLILNLYTIISFNFKLNYSPLHETSCPLLPFSYLLAPLFSPYKPAAHRHAPQTHLQPPQPQRLVRCHAQRSRPQRPRRKTVVSRHRLLRHLRPHQCQPYSRHYFPNYPKGQEFSEAMDVLSDGILNRKQWAYQQRVRISLMSSPKFRSALRAASLKKVTEGLLPLLDQIASQNSVVDLCEMILRFSFDLPLIMVLRVVPGCLVLDFPEMFVASNVIDWLCWLLPTNPQTPHPISPAPTKKKKEKKEKKKEQDSRRTSTAETAVDQVDDKLVYLHASVYETLRLYPSMPYNIKLALQDDVLPSGHKISAGQCVFISMNAMARTEEVLGEDCLEFKPKRWIDQDMRLSSRVFTTG